MTITCNLTCDKNTSFSKDVIWTDDTGVPVDLTGFHAFMQVREYPSRTLVLDLSDTTTGITVDVGHSKIVIGLAPADTAAAKVGIHRYDLIAVSPSGEKKKLIEGQFVINDTITEV